MKFASPSQKFLNLSKPKNAWKSGILKKMHLFSVKSSIIWRYWQQNNEHVFRAPAILFCICSNRFLIQNEQTLSNNNVVIFYIPRDQIFPRQIQRKFIPSSGQFLWIKLFLLWLKTFPNFYAFTMLNNLRVSLTSILSEGLSQNSTT